MIKVLSFWDFGWNTPIKEYDLWHYPLRDFGVYELIMCPISGINNKGIVEYKNIHDAIDKNKNLTIVFVDERGKAPLSEFEHPENALYICGRASYSPLGSWEGEKQLSIRIETPENKGLLWGHQAITLVLYDRMLKDGNHSN